MRFELLLLVFELEFVLPLLRFELLLLLRLLRFELVFSRVVVITPVFAFGFTFGRRFEYPVLLELPLLLLPSLEFSFLLELRLEFEFTVVFASLRALFPPPRKLSFRVRAVVRWLCTTG